MKLYHAPISTCSQKVRLVLAEKGLSYDSEFLDLQKGDQFKPEYLAKNPAGVVPTLEDDGNVLTESTLINEYLQDAYTEPSLVPAAPVQRHSMRRWCKQIDELHPSCGVQTYAIGVRPGLLKRSPEEIAALVDSIPDPVRRAVRRSVVDHGVRAPEFAGAYEAHVRTFDLADKALSESPFLVGAAFSLADAALLPYVLRVDHLKLAGLLAGRAALHEWYERVQARPAYTVAITEYLPDAIVENFRRAGAAVAQAVVEEVAQIVSART
jgi:glutathione S-transferase